MTTHDPPRFISFEGIDGCGKSTLIAHLSQWLDEAGIVHITTREPGGTTLGEQIRTILLDPVHQGMNQQAEVLLYTASRAQLTAEVIGPALARGLWVLSDRYTDATLAYQGYGRGLDLEALRRIQVWATGGLLPDRTILLDCSIDVATRRLQTREEAPDRMELERRSFHERVRQGYLDLAQSDPRRFLILDARNPLEELLREFHEKFLHEAVKR